jgi:hypothetical protein
MRCAAERRLLACLTAACLAAAFLLAGCTHGAGGGRALTPAQRLAQRLRRFGFLPHPVFFGGGGAVAFIGGAASGGPRPKISVPFIPPANSSLVISMPLDAYQAVSAGQQQTLAEASNLLIQRCMTARGFDYTSPPSAPFAGVATLQQTETAPAGLTSLAQAQTFGFAQPKGAGTAGAGPGGPAIIGFIGATGFAASLKAGAAYTEALYGFSPGGGAVPAGHRSCLQQASQQTYGPLNGEPVPDPVPQIAGQAVSFTQTDPRVRAADHAWSRCMARRYYRYASPGQAEGRGWPSPPSKAEIATAVSDVTCKTRANLVNTWLAVEAAYQQALIGQNLTALSQLQANFAPLLRRAQAALAAPAATLAGQPGEPGGTAGSFPLPAGGHQ